MTRTSGVHVSVDSSADFVVRFWIFLWQGSDTSVYLRQYKADGTIFWNHVFVAALRNSENKIINYVGIQHPLDKVSPEGNLHLPESSMNARMERKTDFNKKRVDSAVRIAGTSVCNNAADWRRLW